MQKVKLIKREDSNKPEKQLSHPKITVEPKLNTMVETVKDWVEQSRAVKNRSPRKQFTALFSS
jgi:hypothetical protein